MVDLFNSTRDTIAASSTDEPEFFDEAWLNEIDFKVPQVLVWRVEKFQIKPWPKDAYGKFFIGDTSVKRMAGAAIDSLCILCVPYRSFALFGLR